MRNADTGFTLSALKTALYDRLAIAPGSPLAVAYSGGLDSHVLLHALAALRMQGMGVERLLALHVDHGIHPDSMDWVAHCAQTCTALNVAFESRRIRIDSTVADGLEATARAARYTALKDLLEPGHTLLTAHQLDDQAETVLLQLFRGAGLRGLSGIAAVVPFGRGRLARPLLAFTRADLRTYATAHRLDWIEDDSNASLKFRRNLVRHKLLPAIMEHWPGAGELLARSARHAAEAVNVLESVAADDYRRCQRSPDSALLSIVAMRALPSARMANLLRYWLGLQDIRPPSTRKLDELMAVIQHNPVNNRARISWPGVEVWRYRDDLGASVARPYFGDKLDIHWLPPAPLILPQIGMRILAEPAVGQGIARERLPDSGVHVRLRRGGETCRLPGRDHHHKVKKLLQARHIAPWKRARLPLIYVEEELAAIADLWVCEPYAARANEPGLRVIVQEL